MSVNNAVLVKKKTDAAFFSLLQVWDLRTKQYKTVLQFTICIWALYDLFANFHT